MSSCFDESALLRIARGEVSDADRASIESHLDACGLCRRVVALLVQGDGSPLSAPAERTASIKAQTSPLEREVSLCGRERGECLAPGKKVGSYLIEKMIGRGGMGEVYEAKDAVLGRKVAVKVIRTAGSPSNRQLADFLEEARTTARFNHPNIVTLHHVEEQDGLPILVLEHIDGQNLRSAIDAGSLSTLSIARLASGIAAALQEAHQAGVLHRDLKPENVVVGSDGRPRVLDFGLAFAFAGLDDQPLPWVRCHGEGSALTGSTGLCGTPRYLAPEAWSRHRASEASDIWAFGVILFEMIFDRHPFQGESPDALRRAIEHGASPKTLKRRLPDELRDRLRALSRSCLSAKPHERPTASALVSKLDILVSEAAREEKKNAASALRRAVAKVDRSVLSIFSFAAIELCALILFYLAEERKNLLQDWPSAFVLVIVATLCLTGGLLGLRRATDSRAPRVFLIALSVPLALVGSICLLGGACSLLPFAEPENLSNSDAIAMLACFGLVPLFFALVFFLKGVRLIRADRWKGKSEHV